MNNNYQETNDAIPAELEAARTVFHALLASFSESDFHRQSRNPGWTNDEILTHMTFGFIILNALLPTARLWGRFPRWTSKIFASALNAFTSRLSERQFLVFLKRACQVKKQGFMHPLIKVRSLLSFFCGYTDTATLSLGYAVA